MSPFSLKPGPIFPNLTRRLKHSSVDASPRHRWGVAVPSSPLSRPLRGRPGKGLVLCSRELSATRRCRIAVNRRLPQEAATVLTTRWQSPRKQRQSNSSSRNKDLNTLTHPSLQCPPGRSWVLWETPGSQATCDLPHPCLDGPTLLPAIRQLFVEIFPRSVLPSPCFQSYPHCRNASGVDPGVPCCSGADLRLLLAL